MKKALFFLLMQLCIVSIYAQNQSSSLVVKAQITDSKGVSIPFATIVVVHESSQNVESQLSADNTGKFSFNLTKTGKFILRISAVGFNSLEQKITIDNLQKNIDLDKIKLTELVTEIGEVNVVELKKLITVEADKISYNSEADPDSKTSTALEMLRRVPMVTVDGDDKIQLKGNSNFKVFLDGKPSIMLTNNPSDFLKNFPASNIKNIEVITSPGAKYDAEGIGGIINIVTFKKLLGGYTCTLRGGIDNLGMYNLGTYYAATIKKFSFSVNLSSHYRSPLDMENISYRENYLSENQHFMNTEGINANSGLFSWGSGEVSYEIDSLNLLSASFSFHSGNNKSESESETSITDINKQLAQAYLSNSSNSYYFGAPEGNIDYQHTFKKNKKQMLTLSYKFDFELANQDNEQSIVPQLDFYQSRNIIDKEEMNSEHTFQVDYVQPLKNGTLEIGAKDIYRFNTSNSDALLFDFIQNQFINDEARYIDFEYSQNIIAAYFSLNQKFKNFGYKAGLRVENSSTDAVFNSNNGDNFNNSNFEYVPSASLSYQFNPQNSLQLAYNKRIQRPGIWYLNPYVDDLNPKNVSYGNPLLKPEHYHSLNLNYNKFMKKGNINLSAFYSFSSNGIDRISWIESEDVAYSTYENVKKIKTLGGSISLNYNFSKKFSVNNNSSLNFNQLENATDANKKNQTWGFNSYLRVQYSFKKDFRLSAFGGYFLSAGGLETENAPFYYSGISASKEFFEKRLNISLSAQNIFWKTMSWESETTTTSYYQKSEMFRPGRSFRLNISYRFGQMHTQVKKANRGINNDDLNKGGNSQGGGEN